MNQNQKVFFSDDFVKDKAFDEGIKALGLKYRQYFDARPKRNCLEEKDSLPMHYWTVSQYGTLTFGFLPESDIDEEIKAECIALFDRIYNRK